MSNTNTKVTKATMRAELVNKGIVLTDAEFKKMKKDDMIRLLGSVEVKENEEKKVDTRSKERQRVVFALIIAWVYQTVHPFSNNKALFYRAKDPKYTGLWLAEGRRLARVTGDVLMLLYNVKLSGKQFNKQVAIAYNLMIEAGLCHKNGEYIAMTDTERTKCVRYYTSNIDFIKESIALYEKFVSRK